MYEDKTAGQLLDRMDALAAKDNPTVSDRNEFDALSAEMERRSGSPREERVAMRASVEAAREAAGYGAVSGNGTRSRVATPEDQAFTGYLRHGIVSPGMTEVRAVSNSEGTQPGQISGTGGTAGGYMVAQEFWNNLQIALKQYGGTAASYKQIETPTGAVMPWPTNDPTSVIAALVSEGTQLSTDSGSYVFGQGVLNAWTYATNAILVSRQLVNDSEFDVDGFLADRIGEQLGRAVAAHAISGTGSSQPLGIIPALNSKGTSGTVGSAITATGGFITLATAASVKTFANPAGATELVQNVLSPATCLAMVSAVDPAYWPNASWHMSPQQALNMHSVIDANGRPLLNFAEGMQDGAIGTLLGFPVMTDANLPALTASTTGGPVFGDLSRAMVKRTVRDGGVLRLSERYADLLAYGYIGYLRTDIRSNDLRAAVTVKPAAT
jgi:HK97 family phage major capsid protein